MSLLEGVFVDVAVPVEASGQLHELRVIHLRAAAEGGVLRVAGESEPHRVRVHTPFQIPGPDIVDGVDVVHGSQLDLRLRNLPGFPGRSGGVLGILGEKGGDGEQRCGGEVNLSDGSGRGKST